MFAVCWVLFNGCCLFLLFVGCLLCVVCLPFVCLFVVCLLYDVCCVFFVV